MGQPIRMGQISLASFVTSETILPQPERIVQIAAQRPRV
ncbi:hypothetical protein CP97_05215 [Aurantiacibacter atlanticus]|uniref:Uncharacterized protein n=1 Tax=Aurantiacibacter atlanticus TaxID=1648404 RepID=A0A0H4VAR3_9SPHN|nr:hypothetical protein CP97_05215 [Aurantiacibacter atlanticus]